MCRRESAPGCFETVRFAVMAVPGSVENLGHPSSFPGHPSLLVNVESAEGWWCDRAGAFAQARRSSRFIAWLSDGRVRALQGRRPGRKPGQNAGGEGYAVIGESPRIAWGTLMAYWCLVPSGPLCPPSLMAN